MPSWKKQQGICFMYYKIHFQLHLASPKRTLCYVFLRHVPTRHAFVWDDIWAQELFYMHFPWIFPWHHEKAGTNLRGILALLTVICPLWYLRKHNLVSFYPFTLTEHSFLCPTPVLFSSWNPYSIQFREEHRTRTWEVIFQALLN